MLVLVSIPLITFPLYALGKAVMWEDHADHEKQETHHRRIGMRRRRGMRCRRVPVRLPATPACRCQSCSDQHQRDGQVRRIPDRRRGKSGSCQAEILERVPRGCRPI
ncbi:hypothetical protein BIFADO_01129 [Bifidobacterium adolescentis L2-32]|uniref:Uncharacterized protein n=1 Tax=Bifidobacterium adolescentis L2-32 TaxID=411481 RepID=A7A5L0_BIFAD|nr:hypothetical protein BIFADO_01129 [Bifidobacterium adolescentis L2-32]